MAFWIRLSRTVCAAAVAASIPSCAAAPGHAPAGGAGSTPATTRTYYVAADEVEWDYAPTGTNLMEGRPFDEIEKTFMEPGKHVIGRKAKKAIYREYTDQTFTTLKTRPSNQEHIGFLGPLIRRQVGDTIQIVFRNNAKFPASVHPHGVFYKKTRRARFTTTARPALTRPMTA